MVAASLQIVLQDHGQRAETGEPAAGTLVRLGALAMSNLYPVGTTGRIIQERNYAAYLCEQGDQQIPALEVEAWVDASDEYLRGFNAGAVAQRKRIVGKRAVVQREQHAPEPVPQHRYRRWPWGRLR